MGTKGRAEVSERWLGVGVGAVAGGFVLCLFGSSILPIYGSLMGLFVGPFVGAAMGAVIPWRITVGLLLSGMISLLVLFVWEVVQLHQNALASYELPVGQSPPEIGIFWTLAIPALALIGAAIGAMFAGYKTQPIGKKLIGVAVGLSLIFLASLGLFAAKQMGDASDFYHQSRGQSLPTNESSPSPPSTRQTVHNTGMQVQIRYLDGHLFDAQYPNADPAHTEIDPQTSEPCFVMQTADTPTEVLTYYKNVCNATNLWEYKGQNAWEAWLRHRDPELHLLIVPNRKGPGTTITLYPSGGGKTAVAAITNQLVQKRTEQETEERARIPQIRAVLLSAGTPLAYPGSTFARADGDGSLFLRAYTTDQPEQVATYYNRIATTAFTATTLTDGATVWRGDLPGNGFLIHATIRQWGKGNEAITSIIFY